MADEKLNTGPAENISPEAAEPIATPEQAVASEPQQEQTGPAIPEPGDVVVSFDKINELMAEMSTAPITASAFLNTPAHSTPKFLAGHSARPSTVSMKMWYCPLSLKC